MFRSNLPRLRSLSPRLDYPSGDALTMPRANLASAVAGPMALLHINLDRRRSCNDQCANQRSKVRSREDPPLIVVLIRAKTRS